MADVTFTGLDELLAKLEGLSQDMKRRGGRFALRKAAQVISKRIKDNAKTIDDPKSAADISKNVTERWNSRLFKSTGDLGFRVGIMGGAGGNRSAEALAGNPGGDTRHWRHVEFGTEKTRAQPFFRRAGEESAQAATDEFVVQYGKAIDRALKKARK